MYHPAGQVQGSPHFTEIRLWIKAVSVTKIGVRANGGGDHCRRKRRKNGAPPADPQESPDRRGPGPHFSQVGWDEVTGHWWDCANRPTVIQRGVGCSE